jgi:hypothetical protein
MIFTFVFAAINLIWNFPTFLNIILDIYLPYRILWSCVLRMLVLVRPNESWCQERFTNKLVHNKSMCGAKLLALEILLGFVIGLASAVA